MLDCAVCEQYVKGSVYTIGSWQVCGHCLYNVTRAVISGSEGVEDRELILGVAREWTRDERARGVDVLKAGRVRV